MLTQLLLLIIILGSEFATVVQFKEDNELRSDYDFSNMRRRREDCDDDKLMALLANIQVVNPESVVNLAFEKLSTVCGKLKQNIKTIKDYLRSCRPVSQEDLYYSLVKGVMRLNKALCKEGGMRSEYKTVSDCIQKQDFRTCKGDPDWNEDSDKHKICKSYNKIIACYSGKASASCGEKAGVTLSKLMKEVLEGVLPLHCPEINDDSDFYEEDSIIEKFRTTVEC